MDYLAGFLLLLLALIIYQYYRYARWNAGLLEGLWVGSADFCQRAGIGGLWIYIGPEKLGSRTAVLIMILANDNVANIQLTLNISPASAWNHLRLLNTESRVLEVLGAGDLMPESQIAEIDYIRGYMSWIGKDDGVLYTELYRDNEASDLKI